MWLLEVEGSQSTSGAPRNFRNNSRPSTEPYRWEPPADYLPRTPDQRARLALALYREALGLEHNNVPYAFLGFAKILNLGGNGKKQIDWINSAIGGLKDHFASQRVAEIQGPE